MQALQALHISQDQDMRVDVLYGRKKIIIIKGHCDYHFGPVMICCHIAPWAVMADITKVFYSRIGHVREEEYREAGFKTRDELLKSFRKHYPDMGLGSPVTVIRWENVRGWLVDRIKAYEQKLEELRKKKKSTKNRKKGGKDG